MKTLLILSTLLFASPLKVDICKFVCKTLNVDGTIVVSCTLECPSPDDVLEPAPDIEDPFPDSVVKSCKAGYTLRSFEMSSDDVGSQLWIINPTNGRWGNKFTWDILVEPLEETNPAEIDLVYSRDHSNMRTIRLWPGTNKPVVSTGSHDDIAPFIYRIEGTIQCEGRTRTLKTTNGNIPNMKPDTPQYRIERSTQPENRVVGDIVGSKTYCSAGFLSYSGSMKITHTASAGVDIEKMAVTLGIAVEETIPLTLVPNYPVPEGWRGWLYKVAVTQYWDLYRRHYDWKGDPGPEALDGIIYKHYTDLFPEKEINPECGGN